MSIGTGTDLGGTGLGGLGVGGAGTGGTDPAREPVGGPLGSADLTERGPGESSYPAPPRSSPA